MENFEQDSSIMDAINEYQKEQKEKSEFQKALELQNDAQKKLEEADAEATAALNKAKSEDAGNKLDAILAMERQARLSAGLDPDAPREEINPDEVLVNNPTTAKLKKEVDLNTPVTEEEEYDYGESQSGIVINHSDIKLAQKGPMSNEAALQEKVSNNVDDYVSEMDAEIDALKEAKDVIENEVLDDEDMEEVGNSSDNEDIDYNAMPKSEFDKKYNEAVVVIDKFKVAKIDFTDEEREKLRLARTITLKQVTTQEVKELKIKKKKPKLDQVIKSTISNFSTVVPLIASGYTAKLSGCSVTELMAIISTLDENNPVENFSRKTSLLYEKILETSIGKLTYDEFLEKTCHVDLPMLMYGLACATFPEEDTVDLICNNEKCGKPMPHKYNMRSLLRVERFSDIVKEKIAKTVDNSYNLDTSIKYATTAPVNTIERLEFPHSKIVADFEYKSLASFKRILAKQFNENIEVPTELADIYGFSLFIKAIYVPDHEDDGYFEYTDQMEVTKILNAMNRIDLGILYKKANEMGESNNIEFGYMNIDCPHCKAHYNSLSAEIDQLLFTRCRLEMNTIVE